MTRDPTLLKSTYDITIEDVVASKLLPCKIHEIKYIGKDWFKDANTGIAYHMVRGVENGIEVKETRKSKPTGYEKQPYKYTPTTKPKMVTILCCDCGAERIIHSQDFFQVKKCVLCQRKARNKKRLARLKSNKEINGR